MHGMIDTNDLDVQMDARLEADALSKIEAWAWELESGEYRQGKSCLRSVDNDDVVSHCCLGVYQAMGHAPMTTSDAFLDAADWELIEPILGQQLYYSELNDHGMPFPMIADILRLKVEIYTLRKQARERDC